MITHLRGIYAVQQRGVHFLLRIIDAVLSRIFLPSALVVEKPKRLLMVLQGHLGDAVLLTSLIKPIQHTLGGTMLGVVAGSGNRAILSKCSDIKLLHTYDPWRASRSGGGLFRRFWLNFSFARSALIEIRKQKYDIVIALSSFFANGVIFSWLTKIPVRIGYISGCFGPLLTHRVAEPKMIEHITQYHLKLLYQIEGFECVGLLQPKLPVSHCYKDLPDRYILLAIGAGHKFKKWPTALWSILATQLQGLGFLVVLAGRGPLESKEGAEIVQALPDNAHALDLCDKLGWDDFVSAVERAELVTYHDSVAGHLASCFRISTVVLFSGVRGAIYNFSPLNDRAICLTESLPCNPCFMVKKGCETMGCIREITVERVLAAGEQLIGKESEVLRK